jgi:exoribonuclease R
MTCIRDPKGILKRELARLYDEFKLPGDFPPDVLANANEAASRRPDTRSHRDRTDLPFATLDPASSTDLDQAFRIERSGADIILHYAIADVPWFVDYDSAMAREAWSRGETIYLPGDRMSLYPEIISQGVASLLPDGPRPAVVFIVRVGPDGIARLDGVERALIRSRAKLAYETVTEADLPDGFAELALRVEAAERERGAARIDTPEQELEETEDGHLRLSFRKRHRAEDQNAALSLAANLAVAQFLLEHHTGLFRVMDEPDAKAVARLRLQAAALDVDWPSDEPLKALERRLDPDSPDDTAMMLAIRRAGHGASYAPYSADKKPWHAAVAATYAHATAPLRRLADRYVIEAALALANGRSVPRQASDAFSELPSVMARAGSLAGRTDAAVLDLAEAVMLRGREGELFNALVIDADDKGRVTAQLAKLPVVVRVNGNGVELHDAKFGEHVRLRLDRIDLPGRKVQFSPVQDHTATKASQAASPSTDTP